VRPPLQIPACATTAPGSSEERAVKLMDEQGRSLVEACIYEAHGSWVWQSP